MALKIAINMKPFQGLKHLTNPFYQANLSIAINMKPFQGLKQLKH